MKKLALVLLVGTLMAGCGGNEESADSDGNDSAKAPIVEKWDEWEANPKPFGGLEVLARIRNAKESNATELNLESNEITDLTPLAGLTYLTHLNLYDNQITDLAPLAGLTNLTKLNLNANLIADLSPLAGLTNLTTLDLHGNKISDPTPLARLTNLKELWLASNSIPDDQKDMLRKGLPKNCTIHF